MCPGNLLFWMYRHPGVTKEMKPTDKTKWLLTNVILSAVVNICADRVCRHLVPLSRIFTHQA